MKWLMSVAPALLFASFFVTPVAALDTTPTQPVLPTSSLMITSYQASLDGLDLVQVYNNSEELLSLDGMTLRYSQTDGVDVEAVTLNGYMRPYSHMVIAAEDVLVDSSDVEFRFVPTGLKPKTIWVGSANYAPVTIPTDMKTDGQVYKRGRTATGYSTAASALNGLLVGTVLEADRLYQAPGVPLLQVVEISARSRECSPFEVDARCGDYIKLRVLDGFVDSDAANYRLRTGGMASVSNTFSLTYSSRHGDYLLQRVRDDGELMSLVNGGGYVWLEDSYGLQKYEDSVVQYADAGGEMYIDQSWALNDESGEWQWATPSPISENQFPEAIEQVLASSASSACPAGKYRNPETNRCRSIEDAVSELAACDEGKERSPVTNRCRSVVSTAATTSVPCDEGQERNPATNRCRSVMAVSQTLTPCRDGYERNSATNRCRKSAAMPIMGSATEQAAIQKSGGSLLTSMLLITAGIGAAGYGVYEWRNELWRGGRKVIQTVLRK